MFLSTCKCVIIACRKEQEVIMNKEEQILKLLENNMGIITTEEIVRNNINRVFLTRLVKKGKIERIKKGLYVLSSTWGDEYFNLIYGNNAIFSYETALYFLGLCQTVPARYHITVNRDYNGSLKIHKNVKLHYVKKELFELGKITIQSPQGQNITCYDAERCICDLLKDKENQDVEIVKYAIVEYLSNKKDRNLPKLLEYSKKLNVEEEVSKYLEVLM